MTEDETKDMLCLHLFFVAAFAVLAIFTGSSRAQGQEAAEALSARFREAAQRALPGVVAVRSGIPSAQIEGRAVLEGPALPEWSGSGVVIDASRGWILTSENAVRGGGRIVVTLPDGSERLVSDLRRDARSGLAVAKVPPDGLRAASWSESDQLEVGDWVIALSRSATQSASVTAGIVSASGTSTIAPAPDGLIHTDASISSRAAGGPLVNLRGEVVGICLAKSESPAEPPGMSLALPAARARRIASDLAETGAIRRGTIGAFVSPLDPAAAARIGQPAGARIVGVTPSGPAASAGLQVEDVIVAVRGQRMRAWNGLQLALEDAPIGEPLPITVLRNGQETTVSVRPIAAAPETTLASTRATVVTPSGPGPTIVSTPSTGNRSTPPTEPSNPPALPTAPPDLAPARPTNPSPPVDDARAPSRFPALGLRLSVPTTELVRRFNLEKAPAGLFVLGIEPGGPADQGGLEIGMVITDAVGKPVRSLSDFRAALAGRPADRDIVLRILRGAKVEYRVILSDTLPPAGDSP